MSGAEAAIAGIGFLCNAMQIVTFGRDILQVYKHVRNEHSPDPRLKCYLESAKACFDDMNSSASQVLPSTRDQQQIIDIGKKLEESMTQLQSKFSELHIDDASRRGFRGKLQVGKKSLATLWQGKELESLEVNLKRYESLLHGVVLHRICNQSQAAEISSQQSFHQLNTDLQAAATEEHRSDLAHQLWTEQPNVRDKRDGGDWDMNELNKALCWAIKYSGNTYCIFLDGLDEAKEFEDLPWGDHQNTQVIYELLKLGNIKLCASSREESHFCRFFTGQPCLRTHQLNRNDIYHFAKNRLETSGLSSDDRSRLLWKVVGKANGVFLWVVLVVKSLNKAIRSGGANEFEERLAQTPSDLHDLLVDMWNRPGDDAKLSTYNIEASRFFSLALTAVDIEKAIKPFYESGPLPLHSVRSLLVMATAVEDKTLSSIWSTGREIGPDDLQARCERAESRLQLVSRGLLEVTTLYDNDDSYAWAGNEALQNNALRKVEFIHRCAFDFVTDTQFGRECLALCHWPLIEQVERLLAGHLVKSRFLCHKPIRYRFSIDNGKTTETYRYRETHQLLLALNITACLSESDMPFCNRMHEQFRDWQQCGLFYDHLYWDYPIITQTPSNPRELEYLENVIRATTSSTIILDFINQLPIELLADAVPVLLRAMMDAEWTRDSGFCLDFVDSILDRLNDATGNVRNATRLLHSWFIMESLTRVNDEWRRDVHRVTDLLRRIGHTISLTDDWQSTLILEFGSMHYLGILPMTSDFPRFSSGTYALAICNFVTAYRILGQLLPDLGGYALHVMRIF
ncbi:hypothetical protein FPRO05_13611 [Fusarium proliferatum]|uniref:DUF7791 domain-containing protein n=1 Tax=Gibberella intermedia TaxID=948311 RepID=A0A365MXA8_GIBIN|nr:hypothetical protein FPRO05_13611 [Fusarium proliferatum]